MLFPNSSLEKNNYRAMKQNLYDTARETFANRAVHSKERREKKLINGEGGWRVLIWLFFIIAWAVFGHYKLHYIFFFPVVYFSHRRSARIKKLIDGKLTGGPKNLGIDTFPHPVCHFGAPWQPFWIFEVLAEGSAVSEWPRRR